MHKLAEKIADCLKAKVEGKGIDNIEGQDLVELGMWTDIIKDLVCYDKDKKIIEAMDEAEEADEAMKYIEENSFIDKTMATICQDFQRQQDIQLVNGILQVAMKVGYNFNEEKIKHWLEFCNKMNNIDKTDLIDIAVSNKFAELNKRIKDLEYENGELKERIGLLEEDWED